MPVPFPLLVFPWHSCRVASWSLLSLGIHKGARVFSESLIHFSHSGDGAKQVGSEYTSSSCDAVPYCQALSYGVQREGAVHAWLQRGA